MVGRAGLCGGAATPLGVPTGFARRRRARPPVELEPLLLHAGENFFVQAVRAPAARYLGGGRVGRTYDRILRGFSDLTCFDIFNRVHS